MSGCLVGESGGCLCGNVGVVVGVGVVGVYVGVVGVW